MTDRDKLIGLLGNLSISCEEKIGCINCKYNKEMCCKLKRKADYLLENGVIVPPCEVGDTVYMPWEWNGTNGVAILTVTHIIINGLHSYIKAPFYSDDEEYSCKYDYGRFDFNDIGKTVFLTREEAEKALAKRNCDIAQNIESCEDCGFCERNGASDG